MFRYDGYIIKTIPDYKEAIENGETIEDLYCEVYTENDKSLENCIHEFNMMPCFEYTENTVSEVEKGIRNMIDCDSSYIELKVKSNRFERQAELFYRAVEYIKESIGGDDIAATLSKYLGMTDEEISEVIDETEVLSEEMTIS